MFNAGEGARENTNTVGRHIATKPRVDLVAAVEVLDYRCTRSSESRVR
jgi:hypothetical protein